MASKGINISKVELELRGKTDNKAGLRGKYAKLQQQRMMAKLQQRKTIRVHDLKTALMVLAV